MVEIVSYLVFIVLVVLVWQVSTKAIGKSFELNELKDFALNITGTFVLKISLENKILDVNSAFIMHTNFEKDEIVNKMCFEDFVSKVSEMEYKDFLAKIYAKGFAEAKIFIMDKEENDIFIELSAKAFKDDNGSMYYIFVCKNISDINIKTFKDDAEIKIISRELATSDFFIQKSFTEKSFVDDTIEEIKNRHRLIVDSINVGMIEFDAIENKIFLSDKCREIFEIDGDLESIKAKDIFIKKIYADDYYKLLKMALNTVTNKLESFKCTFRILNNNNDFRWIDFFGRISYDSKGNFANVAGSLNDITSAYIYQEKIKKLAYFDALTDLYNRSSMKEQINKSLIANKDTKAALIFLDIDDFKFINDSFGHSFGDNVICEMSNRIVNISDSYLVGRFSGDEIAIFISKYRNQDELKAYIEKLAETLSISYNDDEINYSISASMGISLYPEHGTEFESLLKSADIAMNQAKSEGKNRYLIFNEEMNQNFLERIALEKDLRKAISDKSELDLYLQPQFEIKTGKLYGFEALIRWNNKSRGFVSPEVFIPLAEETRLIVPLGKWILKEACIFLKQLHDEGYNQLKVSVNLSPVQLLDETLIENIEDIIKTTKINPHKLEIEITETALFESFETNVKKLISLRNMGLPISLDDFGTGYSFLKYLKELPITTLKIDKSFIDNITSSSVDRKISEKIIELAHIFNLTTIAEGVETQEQLDIVSSIGCDIIQGYLGGKPLTKREIFDTLEKELYQINT